MGSVATWEPAAAPLRQLIECLDNSLSARDRNAQKNAELMLKQAKASLEIDNYLCFLLCNGSQSFEPSVNQQSLHTARSAAGIMLKNHIKTQYATMPASSKSYVQANIVKGIRDENVQIRNFVGNVITELVKQAGILNWPDILPTLTSIASNDSGGEHSEAQDGAMSALLKVCEDNKKSLDKTYSSERPLDYLVPKLIRCTSSPNSKVRANAVASLNVFVEEKAEPVMEHLDAFMQRIFDLANDSSGEVKRRVCMAVNALARIAPTKIAPHMGDLVSYMVIQQSNPDEEDLALEAAEFWLTVGDSSSLREAIGPFLPSIVPVLLQSMIYSEEDVLRLEAETEDAETEDREQDIKPHFANSKSSRSFGYRTNNSAQRNGDAVDGGGDADLSEGEIEPDEQDDADEFPEDEWNLRKCSAAALDTFASSFHQLVFDITLPYLKTNLTHQDWPHREAAVLAIGAIAEGCLDGVRPHLPDLIPFLITLLSDSEPVVRKITCWSLGRYSGWAAKLDSVGKEQLFVPMMDGILKRMLDNDKRVQEAAASAFAMLEERSEGVLENPKYCEVIAKQFAECFSKYKDRNMFILYDCVQTLAEHVGPLLQRPELINYLLPALMKRWHKLSDQSQEMFPLLECLSFVATALGNAFLPYANEIFARCIRIVYQNLQGSLDSDRNLIFEENKDFLISSLDLLSAIIQALGTEETSSLLASTQPNIFDLLPLCLEDPEEGVKQSAYALVGDCAISVFSDLQPILQRIFPILISHLEMSTVSPESIENGYAVANNACWSCGEISTRVGPDMAVYAEALLSRFFTILCDKTLPTSLHENAAVALGRLGIACPDILGHHLAAIAPVFLGAMTSVSWNEEKTQAMRGMCQVVLKNPGGLEQCLLEFLNEMSTVPEWWAKDGGGEEFQKVLDMYKRNVADFDSILHRLPTENEQRLRRYFGI